MRLHWLAITLLVAVGLLGCEALRSGRDASNSPSPASLRSATSPQRGEVGLTGPLAEAYGSAQATPLPAGERSEQTPPPERHASRDAPTTAEDSQSAALADSDPLTLAAECLERGDRASAANHLEDYVRLHPDQLMFRAQLAELLLRLGRDRAAQTHYEQFIADAQAATGATRKQLVNAHTRLMEIAQRIDDPFGEVFHRGVGLLLLVKEQEKMADHDAEFGEEMLCKAIRALSEAKELKPGDPRVRVYLAEAFDRSGNRRAADAERAAAKNAFAPGQLTPTERKQLLLTPN